MKLEGQFIFLSMRIIARKKIIDYYNCHPETKLSLERWYYLTKLSNWNNLPDIKKTFNNVDYVGNERYVFNIKGNSHRLVAIILFVPQLVYIRFIGTHKEYDKINCLNI